jgi:hypothetical protein
VPDGGPAIIIHIIDNTCNSGFYKNKFFKTIINKNPIYDKLSHKKYNMN